MKRLLGFLIMAVIYGCTCLSQIPDQLVYVDQNCEALLPDYTPDVVVMDNCDNATITQVPAAGTVLTSAQVITLVTITAKDISDNIASINFRVVLIDTIPPTIQAGPGLLTYNLENYGKVHRLYHQGIITAFDSLRVNYPNEDQDTSYRHDNLVTTSNPDSKYITSSFTNPDWVMFSADSTYVVDSLGINFITLRLQFETN